MWNYDEIAYNILFPQRKIKQKTDRRKILTDCSKQSKNMS